MGWFEKAAGAVSTAATGGAWSTDGKSGYAQGGNGMLDIYSGTGGSQGGSSALDMIPGIGDARAQERANKQNIELWGKTNAWNERMSNSAYQRGMADMRKAGLNPMLAYQQGGASVPTAQAPTVQAASKAGFLPGALNAMTGITSAQATTQNAASQAAQVQSSTILQTAQTAKEVATAKNVQADTALKQRELKGKGAKEVLDRKGGDLLNKFFDIIDNSAKPQEKSIKVLGIDKNNTLGPMIKKAKQQ